MEDDLFANIDDLDDQDFENLQNDYGTALPGSGNIFPNLPENLDDLDVAKIDELLKLVRTQYANLEEENARLLQLSNLIKEKIDNCIQRDVVGNIGSEPFSVPLDLNIKPEMDEEEEDEEDDV